MAQSLGAKYCSSRMVGEPSVDDTIAFFENEGVPTKVEETGKVFHFQGDGRGRLPRSVHNHDMISKHVGLQARRSEALAQAEAAAGHAETALDFYFQATVLYAGAQHVIRSARHPFALDDVSRLLEQRG